MQPTPTSSLLAGSAPRLRACTTVFHATLLVSLLALGACRDPKVTSYPVPKEAAAELPASKPVASAPAAVDPTAALPANHPALGGGMPAMGAVPGAGDSHGLPTAAGNGLTWAAPADWQSKPASSMRKATFALPAAGGAAAPELAISAFPGDVGGDVANVNRWRGQVGLAPVSDAEALASIQRIEVNGLTIGVVDVVDPSATNGTHLVGAMVPYDGATWFFKLLGPDPAVAQAKPALLAFLKTVKPATPIP